MQQRAKFIFFPLCQKAIALGTVLCTGLTLVYSNYFLKAFSSKVVLARNLHYKTNTNRDAQVEVGPKD